MMWPVTADISAKEVQKRSIADASFTSHPAQTDHDNKSVLLNHFTTFSMATGPKPDFSTSPGSAADSG